MHKFCSYTVVVISSISIIHKRKSVGCNEIMNLTTQAFEEPEGGYCCLRSSTVHTLVLSSSHRAWFYCTNATVDSSTQLSNFNFQSYYYHIKANMSYYSKQSEQTEFFPWKLKPCDRRLYLVKVLSSWWLMSCMLCV